MKFAVNEVPYDEDNTDSMVNMGFYGDKSPPYYSQRILNECSWYSVDYMKRIGEAPKNRQDPKSYFKYLFGDQKTCKNYTNRNWIWTFSGQDNRNRIYVLVSRSGVKWEFDRRSDDYDKVVDIRKEVENHVYENIV